MTGIDKITGKIISEAEADAAAIISRAQEQCAEIMFTASAESENIKASLEDRAQKEAENIVARAKLNAAMQKRNIMLRARREATDKVFDAAYKEILNLPEEKYCEMVSRFIADAILDEIETEKTNISLYGEENSELPEKYELIFNADDREKLSDSILEGVGRIVIGKMSREELMKLEIAEDTAPIDGGVIVRFGNVECNCSLRAVFSQLRERMENEISTLIFSFEENK
ncbi:MAG: V-type ATP synthase subunit E [Clostridia bacterium]|nr:V-type ATP synthase subunit E [Clostridia bacterium]